MPYINGEYAEEISFETLKGKTLNDIKIEKDEVFFFTTGEEEFKLFHSQDCCENVSVEEVIGDIKDLLDHPILLAEEVSSENPDEATLEKRKAEWVAEGTEYYSTFESFLRSRYESETWTFYKISTIKGSVTIRFYGSSNGYYSERVSFIQTNGSSDAKEM